MPQFPSMPVPPLPDGALAAVPAAGNRRALAMPSSLKFFYGPMDCGKSTLALQINHNHARQGRQGLLLTRYDRSGGAEVTTRVGLSSDAIEVTDQLDMRQLVLEHLAQGRRIDYLIIDEAGFLNPEHVDQLAELADDYHVDVYCFGLLTDFRSMLLPGAKRLVELADEIAPVQVEVLCWCGRAGQHNARVVADVVVREGDTVVVADTAAEPSGRAESSGRAEASGRAESSGRGGEVRYQVLCREHYRTGKLGRSPVGEQLTLG